MNVDLLRIEWQKLIATRPEDARLIMFKNVCIDAAEYARNGAAKSEITNTLADIAVAHAFFGLDEGDIRRIIDDSFDPPLTLAEWLSRQLPKLDNLLGHLLSTTSRVLLNAPTGIGKTMFGIAIAMRLAMIRIMLRRLAAANSSS